MVGKIFDFSNERLKALPMGIMGVVLFFLLVLVIDTLVGGIFYAIAGGFSENEVLGSVIVNVGIWISKIVVIMTIWKQYSFEKESATYYWQFKKLKKRMGSEVDEQMVFSELDESLKSPFKFDISSQHVPQLFITLLAVVFCFRMGYDASLGQLIVDKIGVDPDLIESMELILAAPVLGLIYIGFIGPIFEEIIFRGFMFSGMLRRGYGFWTAATVSSILFAVMHLNIAQGVNAFFIGLLAAGIYYWTGNLKYAMLLHIANNLYVTLSGNMQEEIYTQLNLSMKLGLAAVSFVLGAVLLKQLYLRIKNIAQPEEV